MDQSSNSNSQNSFQQSQQPPQSSHPQIPFTDTKDLFVQEYEIFQGKTNEFITVQYFCNKEGEPTYFPDRTLAALFQVNLSTLRGRFNRLTKKYEGYRLLISEKSKARLSSLHFINWGNQQQSQITQQQSNGTLLSTNTSPVIASNPVPQPLTIPTQNLDDSHGTLNSGASGVSSLHGLVALNHIYLVNVALAEWIANNHERLGTSLKDIESNLTKANLTFTRNSDILTILPKCLNANINSNIQNNQNNNQSPVSSASTSPTLSPTQAMRSNFNNNFTLPESSLYSPYYTNNNLPDNIKNLSKLNQINLPIPKLSQINYQQPQTNFQQQRIPQQQQVYQQQPQQFINTNNQYYSNNLNNNFNSNNSSNNNSNSNSNNNNNNNNNSNGNGNLKKRSFDSFSDLNSLLSLSILSKKVKTLSELNSDDSDIDTSLSPNIQQQTKQQSISLPSIANDNSKNNNSNNNINQTCNYVFCKLHDTPRYTLVDISQIKSFSSFRETLTSIFGIHAFILYISFQDSLNGSVRLNEADEDKWTDFCSIADRVTLKPYQCQQSDLKNILCN